MMWRRRQGKRGWSEAPCKLISHHVTVLDLLPISLIKLATRHLWFNLVRNVTKPLPAAFPRAVPDCFLTTA